MKKFLLLTLIFSAVISTATYAQPAQPSQPSQPTQQAPDPATMLQQMKEKIKPQMVAKTGLTEAQADKVIELNFEMRQAAAGLRDLNEADRTAKIQELKAAKEKKMSELLTPEQIKAVKEFYENLGKNTP
jgi:Spy/CpxP family protein refolding chaperone